MGFNQAWLHNSWSFFPWGVCWFRTKCWAFISPIFCLNAKGGSRVKWISTFHSYWIGPITNIYLHYTHWMLSPCVVWVTWFFSCVLDKACPVFLTLWWLRDTEVCCSFLCLFYIPQVNKSHIILTPILRSSTLIISQKLIIREMFLKLIWSFSW